MGGKLGSGIILFLIISILIGGLVIWSKYTPGQPVEITLSPPPQISGDVSVSGAVNRPGIYPLQAGDSLDDILQAAGGVTEKADKEQIEIHVPLIGEQTSPQKININHAEAWLLEALPGIGDTRAQAIIDYRQKNGPFRSLDDLSKVAGIGQDTIDRIRDKITVSD